MKHLLVILAFLVSGLAFGQSADKAFLDAIQVSDYDNAQTYLADKLDFCVNDDQDYIKRAESISKLQTIIGDHQVSDWELVHKGSSKDGSSQYSILSASKSTKPLRILVYSEDEAVSEIRLEY